MNELECMRAFVKVVEAGSFTEAARQTGAVKSVITKRVNQLEHTWNYNSCNVPPAA